WGPYAPPRRASNATTPTSAICSAPFPIRCGGCRAESKANSIRARQFYGVGPARVAARRRLAERDWLVFSAMHGQNGFRGGRRIGVHGGPRPGATGSGGTQESSDFRCSDGMLGSFGLSKERSHEVFQLDSLGILTDRQFGATRARRGARTGDRCN